MFRFPYTTLSITAAAFSLALAGCSDRPRNVPAAAQLTVEGKDRVVYTADRDGTVWVSDEGNHKVLYSTQVHAGDRLELDANRNQLMLNDRVVLDTGVHHVEHKIFFEPAEPITARAIVSPTEVVVVRPADVPTAATLRAQTSGDLIEVRPDTDGTVWVVSEPDRRIIYSGRILHGDTLVVDPKGNRLTLNGRSVYSESLPHGRYQVYFIAGVR
jgi:hypothetical protein